MPMPKSIKNHQNDSTIPMSSERLTVADMIARSNDPAFREEIRLRNEAIEERARQDRIAEQPIAFRSAIAERGSFPSEDEGAATKALTGWRIDSC